MMAGQVPRWQAGAGPPTATPPPPIPCIRGPVASVVPGPELQLGGWDSGGCEGPAGHAAAGWPWVRGRGPRTCSVKAGADRAAKGRPGQAGGGHGPPRPFPGVWGPRKHRAEGHERHGAKGAMALWPAPLAKRPPSRRGRPGVGRGGGDGAGDARRGWERSRASGPGALPAATGGGARLPLKCGDVGPGQPRVPERAGPEAVLDLREAPSSG